MNILHLAKANISKNRSHTISLFLIILLVSMLSTIGLSVIAGVNADFMNGVDRLNSTHSIFLMTQDMYKDSFEDIVSTDSRVSEYNIEDIIYLERVSVDYGGVVDVNGLIFNLDADRTISIPAMVEEDNTVPEDAAIYLPYYAKSIGYELGDDYTITYKNKPLTYTIAGFFETNEMSLTNGYGIKYYVRNEAFENLVGQIGRSVCILVRFYNSEDSLQFNREFLDSIDVELSTMGEGSFAMDFASSSSANTVIIMIFAALVVGFSLIIAVISLMVIRFRVINSIDNNMHEIGVLQAGGYTNAQIIKSHVLEYVMIALPAALLGVFVSMPLFSPIRSAMTSLTGVIWTLGANVGIGCIAALLITAMLILMVLLSSRRIKKLSPVVALRGGIATFSFRRNFFPLCNGIGGVQMRLGLKNIFAYGKLYAMIGVIVAGFSLAIMFMVVMYQNFVMDTTALIKMVGIEVADVTLTVTPHTDADALALELEEMTEVRKTSMLDWVTIKVENEDVAGFVSSDFSLLETMSTYEGRFPQWDNEIAMPELLADSIGKTIGDSVQVKAGGVTQEFIICGFYSTTNNEGKVSALTLEGFQRMNHNQKRTGINVYLSSGVTVEVFTNQLQERVGIVNVYKVDEDDPYAEAKKKAEEKISNYLEQYDIDSVEYAVIYKGEIILNGSSSVYQIEKLTNYQELANSQIGVFANIIGLTTQFITVISLIILALILSMTIKSIMNKRRRELGALKAGGFTTRELVLQLAISFIPVAVLGTLAGCIAGALLVNPAFGAAFQTMGVANSTLAVNPVVMLVVGLLIVAVTFAISVISAMRIRRISAYELLSE